MRGNYIECSMFPSLIFITSRLSVSLVTNMCCKKGETLGASEARKHLAYNRPVKMRSPFKMRSDPGTHKILMSGRNGTHVRDN